MGDFSNYTKPQRVRYSNGVACAQFKDGRPQLLIVRKRITYAFNMFAMGMYRHTNNGDLVGLFSDMTLPEKQIVLSLNFPMIWYHATLNFLPTGTYTKSLSKFESAFLSDGGYRLLNLMKDLPHGELVWEIPKGKKYDPMESDVCCAVREFAEETGMNKSQYKIHTAKKTQTYVDGNTKYVNTYYFAIACHGAHPSIVFSRKGQAEEISDIRWAGLEELAVLDGSGRIKEIAGSLFRYLKKHSPPGYCY